MRRCFGELQLFNRVKARKKNFPSEPIPVFEFWNNDVSKRLTNQNQDFNWPNRNHDTKQKYLVRQSSDLS